MSSSSLPPQRCPGKCLLEVARNSLRRLREWLLEVELGVAWGVAGVSVVAFVFLTVWFVDPALLALALRFRRARCLPHDAALLVGISNCSWTSCRLGCTGDVYRCWQVRVTFEFVPPLHDDAEMRKNKANNVARLYPNVRGCGYPPELDCESFYRNYGGSDGGSNGGPPFDCWVSSVDPGVALTALDPDRARREAVYGLAPLVVFLLSVLYALCRSSANARPCGPVKRGTGITGV